MKSINFNTGVKRYAINQDEDNVISVNINDVNLLSRIKECQNTFEQIQKEFETIQTPTAEQMAHYDKLAKETIDYAFGTDISAHAFGEMSCLSPLEDGNLVCIAFLEAFLPLVMEDIKKFSKNSKPGISEKVTKYTTFDEPNAEPKKPISIDSLNDRQRAYLESLA